MNRLEFKQVLKEVGINNTLSTTIGRTGLSEDVHYWGNMAIWFNGSYYAVVRGKIPLEVANIIYKKYPNNPYDIRVDGGCSEWNPIDYATDEEYESEIKSYLVSSIDEYKEKCRQARERLASRSDDNKYITTYHIDTKEGLLIFLTEMKDYFLRKNNMPETEVEKYDELIVKINSEILKKVNPSITAYEWMQDSKFKDVYNSSIERDKQTEEGQRFREAILEFDKAVNPFTDESLELDEMGNYLSRVKINGDAYNLENGRYRAGCCHLEISDLATGNVTRYYRSPFGFSFQLGYRPDDETYLNVLHYFTNHGNYESDKGEVIAVSYFRNNMEDNIDIRLNITNGKAGETYEDKEPATACQVAFVYEQLLKAIDYASSITIQNMEKKGNVKKLRM